MSTTSSDDRKFAVFSNGSIQSHAESMGIYELPENVICRLAEDASYRVREIVSRSCEFMRHCKRKKLKSADIEKALHWNDIQPLRGVSNSLHFNCSEGAYFHDNPIIKLEELAFADTKLSERPAVTLKRHWLGKTNMVENNQEGKLYSEGTAQAEQVESNEYTEYYSMLVECLLGDDETLFKEVLQDIRNNPRIGPVITYIVSFVSGTNLVSHDLEKLSRMLFIVKALLSNQYISLQLYLKPLLKAVMYCVLEPLAASINPLNDHWLLRDYGAVLIAQIIYSYPSETDYLTQYLKTCLSSILHDSTRPLCSHYGALMSVAVLGKKTIEEILLPMLRNYITSYLQPLLDEQLPPNTHVKEDAYKVNGLVMFCIEKLHYIAKVGDVNMTFSFPTSFFPVSELFGDSVTVRLPFHELHASKIDKNTADFEVPLPRSYFMDYGILSKGFLSPSKRADISTIFSLPTRSSYHKEICINVGIPRPVKSRYTRLRDSENLSRNLTSTSHTFKTFIIRRARLYKAKRAVQADLLSWL